MPKNIIVLSDGTSQEGGKGHDTNIYKLFRMLEDRTDRQIVFYDQGLGTDGPHIAGAAFGAGIDTNILQCYRFIFDHYQSGDKIFLFGFSRGAATVRSLASFIHYFGILPASRPELIGHAYQIYKNRKRSYDQSEASEHTPQGTLKLVDTLVRRVNNAWQYDLDDEKHGASAEFVRKHPNQWVSIEFLGVWDTVPALGVVALPGLNSLLDLVPAWKHQYHNFKLRKSVKHACHALSIDDERKWFFPSIWKEYEPNSSQKVEQVWFGGSHTDVGGGFWEAGFSDIALEWMVGKALEHDLRLYPASRRYWNFCIAPDATDAFHDPRSTWGKIYAPGKRNTVWDRHAQKTFGPLKIHESVFERARHTKDEQDPNARYLPWILETGLSDDEITAAHQFWLHDEYMYESKKAYDRAQGQRPTGTLAEWRAQPGNTFDDWQNKAENSFETWQTEHVIDLGDYLGPSFAGRRFLMEPWKPVVYCPEDVVQPFSLRDYVYNNVLDILKDDPVYKVLKERVKKINQEIIAKLRRSERKKLLSDPEKIPYMYRIDQDKERWEKRGLLKPPSGGSAADQGQKSTVDRGT